MAEYARALRGTVESGIAHVYIRPAFGSRYRYRKLSCGRRTHTQQLDCNTRTTKVIGKPQNSITT